MEIETFSKKVLCHFLNLDDVTPIAAPAIVKELYLPFKCFLLRKLKTIGWNLGSMQDKIIALYFCDILLYSN